MIEGMIADFKSDKLTLSGCVASAVMLLAQAKVGINAIELIVQAMDSEWLGLKLPEAVRAVVSVGIAFEILEWYQPRS